jgi:phosphonate transport system substrate-binding protein
MKKFMKRFVTTAVVIAVCVVTAGLASAEIRFGILPRLSSAELKTMYGPLAEYLSRETGEKVTIVVPASFDAFKAEVKAGRIDLGFANPLIYVQVQHMSNVEPLALASEVKSGTRFRGIIMVRKDSGIMKLQDLKGKKISFMDKDSAAGYIFQMLLLSKAGLDVERDFTILPFLKKHDKVALAVFDKSADAGGIREDEFEKAKDKVDISQLRIVGYTDYFPNWPMFSTPKLNRDTAAKIRAALHKLKPNDPRNEGILGSAKLTGFIPISNKDFDEFRKAAKVAGAL